jgi:hypothetical protein
MRTALFVLTTIMYRAIELLDSAVLEGIMKTMVAWHQLRHFLDMPTADERAQAEIELDKQGSLTGPLNVLSYLGPAYLAMYPDGALGQTEEWAEANLTMIPLRVEQRKNTKLIFAPPLAKVRQLSETLRKHGYNFDAIQQSMNASLRNGTYGAVVEESADSVTRQLKRVQISYKSKSGDLSWFQRRQKRQDEVPIPLRRALATSNAVDRLDHGDDKLVVLVDNLTNASETGG